MGYYLFFTEQAKLQVNKVRLTIRDTMWGGGYGFSLKICDQAKYQCCVVTFGDMSKGDSFVRSAIDSCAQVEVTKTSPPTVICFIYTTISTNTSVCPSPVEFTSRYIISQLDLVKYST